MSPKPVPVQSFVLYDVQGYSGGRTLWVDEHGNAIIQVVYPAPEGQTGLLEKRYESKVSADDRKTLERLLGEHDFLRLEVRERPGVPDEARPIIQITTEGKGKFTVAKWSNDKHEQFDAIYQYLLSLCQIDDQSKLITEGPFDFQWHPKGFDRVW